MDDRQGAAIRVLTPLIVIASVVVGWLRIWSGPKSAHNALPNVTTLPGQRSC